MAEGGEGQQPELEELATNVAAHHTENRSQSGDPDSDTRGRLEFKESPEDYRQAFEVLAERLYFRATEAVRSNQGGPETPLVSYDACIDSTAQNMRDMADMRLFAAAAGMKEVLPPLVAPLLSGPALQAGERIIAPSTFVQLTYEKTPAPKSLVVVQPSNVKSR
ncbi:hypothetical protein ACH4YO_23415 [Streptomyces noursei]|uniref:hypothetical protein n=1 Tax=Streptomyces noursei TaxID=1971 RepID=UPI0033D2A8E7